MNPTHPATQAHQRLVGQGLAHADPAGLSNEGLTTLIDLLAVATLQGAGSPHVEHRVFAAASSTTLQAADALIAQLQGEPANLAGVIAQAKATIAATRG